MLQILKSVYIVRFHDLKIKERSGKQDEDIHCEIDIATEDVLTESRQAWTGTEGVIPEALVQTHNGSWQAQKKEMVNFYMKTSSICHVCKRFIIP